MAVTQGDDPAPSEDDPFAGLVLDESFVQAAKVSEAPARTRDAIARYAHLEQPVFGTGRPPERGPRSRKRRWITVTAAITVAALLGYIVWLTGRPSHAAAPQAPITQASPSPNPAQSVAPSPQIASTPSPVPSQLGNWPNARTVGECLTWQSQEQAPVSVVSCGRPHVAQVTGNLDVKGRFGVAWPGRAALEKATGEMCVAPFQVFTGLSSQEASARGYAPSALYPSEADWRTGDRRVMCTAVKYYEKPFTGSVENLRKPLTT